MKRFSKRLLQKRAALLKSLDRPFREYSLISSPVDDSITNNGRECAALKFEVNDSIRRLLKMGFTFSKIIKESGVNKSFLEQAFCELGINPSQNIPPVLHVGDSLKNSVLAENPLLSRDVKQQGVESNRRLMPDEAKDQSNVFNEANQISPILNSQTPPPVEYDRQKFKSIEFEIRLLMLRTQLEVNRILASLNQPEVMEQLEDVKMRNQIMEHKAKMIASLNSLFQKTGDIEREGRRQPIETVSVKTQHEQSSRHIKRHNSDSEPKTDSPFKKMKQSVEATRLPDKTTSISTHFKDPKEEPPAESHDLRMHPKVCSRKDFSFYTIY